MNIISFIGNFVRRNKRNEHSKFINWKESDKVISKKPKRKTSRHNIILLIKDWLSNTNPSNPGLIILIPVMSILKAYPVLNVDPVMLLIIIKIFGDESLSVWLQIYSQSYPKWVSPFTKPYNICSYRHYDP